MTLYEVAGGTVTAVSVAMVDPGHSRQYSFTINHIELTLWPNHLRFIPQPSFFFSHSQAVATGQEIGTKLVQLKEPQKTQLSLVRRNGIIVNDVH